MQVSTFSKIINCFEPAERAMLTVAIGALAVNAGLIVWKGAAVDYAGYTGILLVFTLLLSAGLFYRLSGRSERIGSAMICAGAFIFFSACLSMFNYLLLPLSRPKIDEAIVKIDAMFGFHWPDVMAMAAQYPNLMLVLKIAYMSTVLQIALLVVLLGLGGRKRDLHKLLLIVTATATCTICFWGLFPSSGASTMHVLPDEIWAAINPPLNAQYSQYLLDTAVYGPGVITPDEIRGLIGFPSYHAVLAFTAIYCAWNVPFLREIFLTLNLLILPSIFVQGGHHLMDLPGGLIVFLGGVWIANRAVKQPEQTPGLQPNVSR